MNTSHRIPPIHHTIFTSLQKHYPGPQLILG